MPYFAVLNEDNVVDNVIIADSLELAESLVNSTCIEFDEIEGICGIGSKWNGSQFEKSTIDAPPIPNSINNSL